MSGEEKSLQEKIVNIEAAINDYFVKLKVPLQLDDEVENVINLTLNDIRGLTPKECYEYAYVLDKYAFYLQKEYNFHSARNVWAEQNLYVAISIAINQQQFGTYIKFEEKKMSVIRDNTLCNQLDKMLASTNMKLGALNSLSMKVNTIAKTLKDLGYSKRKNEE